MQISGFISMWFRIQSMATENSAGARTHPCLTPDVVLNLLQSFFLSNENLCLCVVIKSSYSIRYMMSVMPRPCKAFHTARQSTQSKAALMSIGRPRSLDGQIADNRRRDSDDVCVVLTRLQWTWSVVKLLFF